MNILAKKMLSPKRKFRYRETLAAVWIRGKVSNAPLGRWSFLSAKNGQVQNANFAIVKLWQRSGFVGRCPTDHSGSGRNLTEVSSFVYRSGVRRNDCPTNSRGTTVGPSNESRS
jgi:hypothetical protein